MARNSASWPAKTRASRAVREWATVVTIVYSQAALVRMAKSASSKREVSITQSGSRAELGQKPGGRAQQEVKAVASIEKIDAATKHVHPARAGTHGGRPT